MGRIHLLSEHVANQIAAGEVVERPASVVKELIENSLDAASTRIRVQIEGGGRKLIQVVDNGCGMVRDDALLAFERHATSKLGNDDDLTAIATLGFRGEALPSIASISRLRLETRDAAESSGTIVEISGGRILTVEEAGLPSGTSLSIRDLFFNVPARRKFLRAESTELAHIASLVTHYALAHPEIHWELHSASNAILVAAPVATHAERIFQVFGRETLDELLPLAAQLALARAALPPAPNPEDDAPTAADQAPTPGELRLFGFTSKPAVQKLNRNSIFIFVNGRLIRDKVILHAIVEAYRNIIPPAVFPVVLLFLEMPFAEVDVNVHPTKAEVRFRRQSFVHDFVRDAIRATLMRSRPAPDFAGEIHRGDSSRIAFSPLAPASLDPAAAADIFQALAAPGEGEPAASPFILKAEGSMAHSAPLPFAGSMVIEGDAALGAARRRAQSFTPAASAEIDSASQEAVPESTPCMPALEAQDEPMDLTLLASLRPIAQLRDSFILATSPQGLWIIDQHAAHERVLFERVLAQRSAREVESQRLLMPLIVELRPAQQAIFAEIADEFGRNGFEVEPFGVRTLAIKAAPSGLGAEQLSHLLAELLEQFERDRQVLNMEKISNRIAASIACHAAIKVNMPLDQAKMEWLLAELSQARYPMSCPHGRPTVLRYSVKEIQKAFKRI